MDHERVAALHDGRLAPRERDELLNELLSDDDEYELFAETAAVLRELEAARAGAPPSSAAAPVDLPAPAAGADGSVIPLASRRPQAPVGGPEMETAPAADRDDRVISLDSRRRPGRTRWVAYGALAAGLAGLALTAALLTRDRGPLTDSERAVAMLEDGAAPGPVPNLDQLWRNNYRGATSTTSHAQLSVKLGAYLVNLELAEAARDTAAVRSLSTNIYELLELANIRGTAAAASIYRDLAQATGAELGNAEPRLALGRQGVRSLALPEWLELGLWAQTARTAAARRDAEFFRERESRAALERAGNLLELEGRATTELAAVRAVLPADGSIDWGADDERWTTLESSLESLLRVAGGNRSP